MSAQEPPPGPPVDPEQLDALVKAIDPVQDVARVGSSVGQVIQSIDGPGTDLIGASLQNQADLLGTAGSTLEVGVNAMRVQEALVEQSLQEVFPPPHVAAMDLAEQFSDLAGALSGGPAEPPDFEP